LRSSARLPVIARRLGGCRSDGWRASLLLRKKLKAARHAPRETDSLSSQRSLARLDGFFQFLRRAERDFLARLDLDRLAGRGIAAHACGALAHLQDAKAADTDAVAFLEVLDDEIDHADEDRLGLLLGKLMTFGDVCREVL